MGPSKVPQFKKLCLAYEQIPKAIKLFVLGEQSRLVIIRQDIKEACEKAGITGMWYINLCEQQSTFGNLTY
jgi:hypothetical protein